jgi:hypothetical protein
MARTWMWAVAGGVGVALAAVGGMAVWWPNPAMAGVYAEVGGPGKLEFKGERVYVTGMLGMTFVAEYELDGDRVIIQGAGGSRVYVKKDRELDAGMGLRYVLQAQ